jgi:hypothetical protein
VLIPMPMAPPMAIGSGPGAIGLDTGGPRPYGAPPRGLGQRLPWILVGALVVAVAALVAYIVIGA